MIDSDTSSLHRNKMIDLVVQKWGRDRVANINASSTFKIKGVTKRYFKLSTPLDSSALLKHYELNKEIVDMIPPPLFGKEPTLKEVIEGNPDKGYKPHPELLTERYSGWYKFVSKMEGLIERQGVHASGVVITDFPLNEQIPTYTTKDFERITQFDAKYVEELGVLKFDILGIDALDVISEAIKLIKDRHNIDIDMYNIEDFDKKTYDLLEQGYMVGVFQFETSKSAKDLTMSIKPRSIDDLSDISAMNRPGPLKDAPNYIKYKESGEAPDYLPKIIAELLKPTNYILIYQETVMEMCNKIAGYSLQETDNIRRSMGLEYT